MYARARGMDSGPIWPRLGFARLAALHDFRESRRWLRERLEGYVCDTLGTFAARQEDWFDPKVLSTALDEHFTGQRDHFAMITFALDIALAHKHFCTTEGQP